MFLQSLEKLEPAETESKTIDFAHILQRSTRCAHSFMTDPDQTFHIIVCGSVFAARF